MAKKYSETQLRRYDNIEEMMENFAGWVEKNGIPKIHQGCICCAELICLPNCHGITDSRVKNILKDKGA